MSYPNDYPAGQCTWGAANLCNWVLRYGNLENALDWAANWRKHGGFVQMTPAVGTVACFQPHSNQADAVFGHVAKVINVSGKSFVVDEMNGPAGPGHYDDRVCTDDPGVSFLREFSPPPPIPKGKTDMWMYQLSNGTTYQVDGNTLVTMGSGADIQLLLNKGWALITQAEITVAFASRLAKLPVIS